MQKLVWIDIPGGWRYGFPKLVPFTTVKNETLLRLWLSESKYPANEIDFAINYYRFWHYVPKDKQNEI